MVLQNGDWKNSNKTCFLNFINSHYVAQKPKLHISVLFFMEAAIFVLVKFS